MERLAQLVKLCADISIVVGLDSSKTIYKRLDGACRKSIKLDLGLNQF